MWHFFTRFSEGRAIVNNNVLKYFVHSLAFLCIPIIIIRGIHSFFPHKEKKELPKFVPTVEPRTKTFWWGKKQGVQFLLAPYTNSKKLNHFNDKMTNHLLKKTDYKYCFFYIANFSEDTVAFDPSKLDVTVAYQKQKYKSETLSSFTAKNSPLYLSWLLKKSKIEPGSIKKSIIALDKGVDILAISSVHVTRENQSMHLEKIICLRKQFDEFIQKPTAQFFIQNH